MLRQILLYSGHESQAHSRAHEFWLRNTHRVIFTIQAHDEADYLPSTPVTSNCS